jgi:hypothetical protein
MMPPLSKAASSGDSRNTISLQAVAAILIIKAKYEKSEPEHFGCNEYAND